MTQPIECRLDADAANVQLGEWQALLSEAATPSQRPSPTELLVPLADAQLKEAVDLARREKACCPFFDFALRIESAGIVLSISVPTEAAAALDAFAGIAK